MKKFLNTLLIALFISGCQMGPSASVHAEETEATEKPADEGSTSKPETKKEEGNKKKKSNGSNEEEPECE